MRLKTPGRRPRRRPVLRTISVVPTLITAGNLVAGVLALMYLSDAAAAPTAAVREALWGRAAWMVFLGMLCDVLDGRIARLTRTTSAFGAELDSLSDMVTFGVVPALLGRALLLDGFPLLGTRLVTALVVVYVLGASLRLARYNVESARVAADEPGHVTVVFRGLPTPAAAGLVASLVLLRHEYQIVSVDWAVLLLTPVLGLLMVSRLPYPHLLNRFLEGSRPLPSVALLAVTVFLCVAYFQETITAVFALYAGSGPVLQALAHRTARLDWALHEEQDEAPEPVDGPEGGLEEPEPLPPAEPPARSRLDAS